MTKCSKTSRRGRGRGRTQKRRRGRTQRRGRARTQRAGFEQHGHWGAHGGDYWSNLH